MMNVIKIWILLLSILLSTKIRGQVHRYYDRGEEWGYHDNSYKYRLELPDSVEECSCEALFTIIDRNDLPRLDSCLNLGAKLNCTLRMEEEFWQGSTLFGKWETRYWKITPYHFALIRDRLEIVQRYEKIYGNLDVPLIPEDPNVKEMAAIDLTGEQGDSIVYYYLKKKGLWNSKQKESTRIFLCFAGQEVRNGQISLEELKMRISEIGDRKLSSFTRQLVPIVNNSIEYNVEMIFKYMLSTYPELLQKDVLNSTRKLLIQMYIKNPTIELYEYLSELNVLSESNLREIGSTYYRRPSSDVKIVSNYYFYYFKLQDEPNGAFKRKRIQKKLSKYRERLRVKNELGYKKK